MHEMAKTPMHRMTPQVHAALGWDWGAYCDGACYSLTVETDVRSMAEFMEQARMDGATVVNLRAIRENKEKA
jgi:hypothetical protein